MKRTGTTITLLFVAALIMAGKPDQTTTRKERCPQEESNTTLALISIPEPAAHTQKADDNPPHWYGALKRPEWWLVGIAILTCFVIAWQAVETRRAAEGTLLSAQAFIESQCAQVAFKPEGYPSKELLGQDVQRVRIALINRGITPAYDLVYESWIEILTFPFRDFTPNADYFKSTVPSTLYPNHAPLVLNIPLRMGLTPEQRADLKRLREYCCIRVQVSYRDAFKSARRVNFGVYVMEEGFGILPRYNDQNRRKNPN